MATGNDGRLVLTPYLQEWDGKSLKINLLLIPRRGSPLEPLCPGGKSFAEANFTFDIHQVEGASSLPTADKSKTPLWTVRSLHPPQASAIFRVLQSKWKIDPNPKRASRDPNNIVRKYAPPSYQQVAPDGEFPSYLHTDASVYSCALRKKPSGWRYRPLPPASELVAWGKVMAVLLRNQQYAEAAGLIRHLDIPISNLDVLKQAGFLWVTLAATSDCAPLITQPDGLQIYAARYPGLDAGTPRPLFTPVMFPVVVTPPVADYAQLFTEATRYDDGWAKVVHCCQAQRLNPLADPDETDTYPMREQGIMIGWDDNQVTGWMNRQLADKLGHASPLGVGSYRVDVRSTSVGDTSWKSLVAAAGPLTDVRAENGQKVDLGMFQQELGVEIHPTQMDAQQSGEFWLPPYFVHWNGSSLIGLDPDLYRIHAPYVPKPTPGPDVKGIPPNFANGEDDKPNWPWPLIYGREYQFRVRLSDHTGGGPGRDSKQINPAQSPIATHRFLRWIRPLRPRLITGTSALPTSPTGLNLLRPLMRSPGVICTGQFPNAKELLLADIKTSFEEKRDPALPDPDASKVEITVQVETLPQDPDAVEGKYLTVFTVTRDFPVNPYSTLNVPIIWEDKPDVMTLKASLTGPVVLPTARNVRLLLKAVCTPRSDYYGEDGVRYGPRLLLNFRQESQDESFLVSLKSPDGQQWLETIDSFALFLRPEPNLLSAEVAGKEVDLSLAWVAARLATAAGLQNSGLTFRAQPGKRTVFGCASAVPYAIGPDRSSITFASTSCIVHKWIVMLKFAIQRDWTWDGLNPNGIIIQRKQGLDDKNFAGIKPVTIDQINPCPAVGHDAIPLHRPKDADGDGLSRSGMAQTEVIYFDFIDPKTLDGSIPEALTRVSYAVEFSCKGKPTKIDPPVRSGEIVLPITAPPTQVPRISSTGIAMSPYESKDRYSRTVDRQKMLWVEFLEPPKDARDSYFARVLRNAPDPLLLPPSRSLLSSPGGGAIGKDVEPDPPLPIALEIERKIVPGEADDLAGLAAMQEMLPSEPGRKHWLLPLPPGMTENSPELFGVFTYEFRVGHHGGSRDKAIKSVWSTAQGRFGAPLRVAGIQHPAPPLRCAARRTGSHVLVSAPYATPVGGKRQTAAAPAGQAPPRSAMWVVLYAQAAQLDGKGWRNVQFCESLARPGGRRQLARFVAEDAGEGGTAPPPPPPPRVSFSDQVLYGEAAFERKDVEVALERFGFNKKLETAQLSVLAVETLGWSPSYAVMDVQSAAADTHESPPSPRATPQPELITQRILRVSCLTPVPYSPCAD